MSVESNLFKKKIAITRQLSVSLNLIQKVYPGLTSATTGDQVFAPEPQVNPALSNPSVEPSKNYNLMYGHTGLLTKKPQNTRLYFVPANTW